MRKKDVVYKHIGNSPPMQPFVRGYAGSYRECQVSWNPYCLKKDALFYRFETGEDADEIELIPDACLNVLIEFDRSNPRALFSGTFLHEEALQLKPNTLYFGFKPYSNMGIKSRNVRLREMVGTYTDFTYAFPCSGSLIEEMFEAQGFKEQINVFMRYAEEHLVDDGYYPTLVDYLAVMLCSAGRNIGFNNMAQVFGYSERYCREKFKDSYGMSPKQYSEIIRFQNTLKALFSGKNRDLCSLAISGGFFDQAHLIHDFRRYTNTPPEKYLKKYTR